MKKKKIYYQTIITVFLLSVWMYGCDRKEKPDITLETMTSDSDVIIEGICEKKELLNTLDNKNGSFSSKQKSSFRIKKIHKDEKNILTDQNISIIEEEIYMPVESEEHTFCIEGYVAMRTGEKYILFLTYNADEKVFYPFQYGKIPLNEDEYIYSQNEKHPTNESKKAIALQKKIADDVRNRY